MPIALRTSIPAVLAWQIWAGTAARAQEAAPPSTEASQQAAEGQPREIGGRLVISSETIEVVANADQPVRDSSIATKTDTPLIETPRSVSIVDRRTLDDLSAVNLTEVHDYTLGITPEDERGPGFSRGFRLGFYDLRRDGLRIYTWSVREPVALERVQYLRGPAAVLYGDGSPGGLVNLMLKKPLPEPRYEASLGAGELGFRRVTADLTGPLSDGRRARYRLVAAAEGLENGFDNDESRVSVLPMLSFDLGSRTTLHLDGEFYDQRGRGYRHTVPATPEAQAGDFVHLPWDLNMASPDDHWRGWNASGGVRLDTSFSERTSLHVAGRYTRIDGDLDFEALLGLAPDGHTAQRALYRERSEWNEYQGDAFLSLSASTGRVRHRIVGGFEAGLSTTDSLIGFGPAPSLDIDAPVYAPRPPEPPLRPTRYDLVRLGLYLQDQIRFGERFTVVPGIRGSRVRLEDRANQGAASSSTADSALSPGLGLVFLPWEQVSLYASYSQGFEPPAPGQLTPDGAPLAPVESGSLETGVKAELLKRRLSLTAAGFWIRQTNVPEPDALGFYRQIGEGRSDGFELQAVGSPLTGLAVRGGYAFTATEITKDAAGFIGNQLPNAPANKVNLWIQYRFTHGLARGLSLGAGFVHVSERFTARDNLVRLPAYTRCDAGASYQVAGPKLALSLSATNLADSRYVTSGAGRSFFAGPPRRVSLTVTSVF